MGTKPKRVPVGEIVHDTDWFDLRYAGCAAGVIYLRYEEFELIENETIESDPLVRGRMTSNYTVRYDKGTLPARLIFMGWRITFREIDGDGALIGVYPVGDSDGD